MRLSNIERLIAEFDSDLSFKFRADMPSTLGGLIIGNTIHINANLPFDEIIANLAEEIGHHKTTSDFDITDYSNRVNAKYEVRARRWGYKKLVPYEKLKSLIESKDVVQKHELAEAFGVPDNFVEEAVKMYKLEGKL